MKKPQPQTENTEMICPICVSEILNVKITNTKAGVWYEFSECERCKEFMKKFKGVS